MRKIIIGFISLFFALTLIFGQILKEKADTLGAPPYGEPEVNAPESDVLSWLSDWERPDVPPKVALQVGHYKNSELPDELEKLRGNSGATGGGVAEWEVNLNIADLTKEYLVAEGVEVEIIPATVPENYWSDVFVAIHADGSTDKSKRGYKIASPWRDYSGKANKLVSVLEESYYEATGWETDPNITRNMRGYYAFSWWRYDHAIHPMTTAVIFETGFLSNITDRLLLVNTPEIPARAIADGVLEYLQIEGLIE
jgi:hypothetical protein